MKKLILLLTIILIFSFFGHASAGKEQCEECIEAQIGPGLDFCKLENPQKPDVDDVTKCNDLCKTSFGQKPSNLVKCQSCCQNLLYGFTSPIFSQSQIFKLIVEFTTWFAAIVFAIAVIMIIYGGVLYITAAGSEEKAKTARRLLLYACIGIAVAILAFGAQFLVQSFLTPPVEVSPVE